MIDLFETPCKHNTDYWGRCTSDFSGNFKHRTLHEHYLENSWLRFPRILFVSRSNLQIIATLTYDYIFINITWWFILIFCQLKVIFEKLIGFTYHIAWTTRWFPSAHISGHVTPNLIGQAQVDVLKRLFLLVPFELGGQYE